MHTDRSISVVLAGYNEEDNIDRAMEEIYLAIASCFEQYELILVDDASTDATLEKMKAFYESHNHVVLLRNYVNLNFGASVLRGLYAAKNDYIVYNACDLPLRPMEMAELVANMEDDTDILVLQRTDYKATKRRRILSYCNGIAIRILFPILVRGTPILNFVQIFKRDVLSCIVPVSRSPIFVWPEMVFRAKVKKYCVKNVKVKCNIENIRKGAFGHFHDIIWGIYDMLRFRMILWWTKKEHL